MSNAGRLALQAALLRGESTEERAHNGFEPSTSSNGKSIEACSSDGLMEAALRLDPVHRLSIIVPVAAGAIEIALPCNLQLKFCIDREGGKVHVARVLVRARGTRASGQARPSNPVSSRMVSGALPSRISIIYFAT